MSGEAFGRPGVAMPWRSSAKDLVTSALGTSRVWVTVGDGMVNEVYWPNTGAPQIRDLGFLVAGEGFWSDRGASHHVVVPSPHVPLPRVFQHDDRYALTFEVLCDPRRDVVLLRYELDRDSLELYALLAPRLGGVGWGTTAWVDRALLAQRADHSVGLVCEDGFLATSVGYVGASDGWQDLHAHGTMTWSFERAGDGNVALLGRVPVPAGVLALGFAETPDGARTLAVSSLAEGYDSVRSRFVAGWQAWAEDLELSAPSTGLHLEAWVSATVLKVHQDRCYLGAVVAGLSFAWGHARSDPDPYHRVWPRDAVEIAFGLLAVGCADDAADIAAHLAATQLPDGSWAQNSWPDGRPHWRAIQLDEVALPILLVAKLRELDVVPSPLVIRMLRRAAGFIARHGPATEQERWEDSGGISPFTLAVEIAALVAAAEYLDDTERAYVLGLADSWNERIEEWTYIQGGELAAVHAVDGHYVRLGPITDQPIGVVGLEFAHLARLGLRGADDPRITNTLRVIEAVLRVDTPFGPAYHRYNRGDRYGEHDDGRPYDGNGVGRAWPLLTGERGHLALQRGEDPLWYLVSMAAMATVNGLIPEQVWDADEIAMYGLFPGQPTGSVTPLVWAHAEFLKLLRAMRDGRPVELLDVVGTRYAGRAPQAPTWFWRDTAPFDRLPPDRHLTLEDRQPFRLRYHFDDHDGPVEQMSQPLGLGMHGVTLTPEQTNSRRCVRFTRDYPHGEHWLSELTEHRVELS